jgi:A/G-specific adenine glycosylase
VEVLLQRTRATSVQRVYEEFRRTFPTAEHLSQASEAALEHVVGSLGLRWRTQSLKALADEIVARGGDIPDNVVDLRSLPGVGEYVTSAYLSLHLNKRAVIVDANVVRWIGRLIGHPVDAETRRKKWLTDVADMLTPRRNVREYNYAVLDLTMKLCGSKPRCVECPVVRFCKTGAENVRRRCGEKDQNSV